MNQTAAYAANRDPLLCQATAWSIQNLYFHFFY